MAHPTTHNGTEQTPPRVRSGRGGGQRKEKRVCKFWRSRRWAKRPWTKRAYVRLTVNTAKVQGPATVELDRDQFALVVTTKVSNPLRKASEA